MMKFVLAGALALATTAAHATVVTPTDLQGWAAVNVRSEATVAITDTYKPAGQGGSLEFNTNPSSAGSSQDKADFAHAVNGTLGSLVDGGALSFDYFVDPSSETTHLTPALRLAFYDDATSKSGYLIWEDVYNGGSSGVSVTKGAWVHNEITLDNFWMRAFGAPSFTVEKFDYSLAEWAGGATHGNSYVLSAATRIIGIEVGVGSGWGGQEFHGAVDNVNLAFGRAGGAGVSANFEPGAVPEPATWLMLILGFGGAGTVIRRQRERAIA